MTLLKFKKKAPSRILKHPGPGGSPTHGTGTDQMVHGHGGGGASGPIVSVKQKPIIPDAPSSSSLSGYKAVDFLREALEGGRTEIRDTGLTVLNTDHNARVLGDGEDPGYETSMDNLRGKDLEFLVRDEHGNKARISGYFHGDGFFEGDIELPNGLRASVYDNTRAAQFVDDLSRAGLSPASELLPIPTPEQLQIWEPEWDALPDTEVDRSLLTHDNFTHARQMFFGTDQQKPGFSNALQLQTENGKANVAWHMENGPHAGRIELEIEEERANYLQMQHEFLDEIWEEAYGDESVGGKGTWRNLMGPQQIEGQTALKIRTAAAESLDIGPASQFYVGEEGYVPPSPARPDDPMWVDSWIRDQHDDTRLDFDYKAHSDRWGSYDNPIGSMYEERKDEFFDFAGRHSTGDGNLIMEDILHNTDWRGEGPKYEQIVTHLRDQWASSATHPSSLAVQLAAEDTLGFSADKDHWEFSGMEYGELGGEAAHDADLLYERFPSLFNGYVDAVYTNTQVRLENAGITHVPVTRGMGLNPSDLGGDLYAIREYGDEKFSLREWDSYSQTWNEVRPADNPGGWYASRELAQSAVTEMGGSELPELRKWTPVDLDLQPLSSFSVSPGVAKQFAGSDKEYRTLTRMLVPKERIWATSLDGFGSMRETEFIVLGGYDLDAEVILFTGGLPSTKEMWEME